MANSEAGRRGSGSQLSVVLAALAVALILGFLVWLGMTSEPSEMMAIREAREADETPVATGDEPTPVSIEEFSANVATYVGQHVRLDNVPVAARMGGQAFWINLTGDVPFLVRIDPALVEEGREVQAGQRVTVSGTVQERTDEVLAAWEQEGVIATPGQRAEAEFADRFLHARRIIDAPAGQ
jgi:hypothetical protein